MKRMLFNATQAEELRVAIVDGQKLIDLDIESAAKEQRKSNIYKGVITRVEPSLEAAFVDYGTERHGFLPFKEISRSYFSRTGGDISRAHIQDVIKEGQELIVQVEKDERGNKGAALTTFISLAGRYLVLMPNNPRGGGVSRRVEGEERDELRDTMAQLEVPQGMSIIARTAGIGRSAEELQWDLNYLMQLWRAIEGAAQNQGGAYLIYQEGSLVIRAIRDYFQPDIGEILIDTEEIYEQARQFMGHVMPANVNKVKMYKDDVPLFSRFQIEHQIETAYARQVPLPSGGAIVIDHTEALVSVDVNSARATRGTDIEQTAFNTNLEAAEEVARQLRLRDLGGLVVIDFIDMESQKHQREVENKLRDSLHFDRARVQMGKISRFGLLELSRQRLQPSLGETAHISCPRCNGTGHIRGTESSALHILRIIQEEAMKENTGAVHAQVPVDVATFLLNEKRSDIQNVETRFHVSVMLVPNMHMETPHYNIVRLRQDELQEVNLPSYQMVENPTEVEITEAAVQEPKPPRQEAVVRGITPAQPAPLPVEKKSTWMGGVREWLQGLFAEKKEVEKPKPRPQGNRRRRDRSGERREEGRGPKPQHPAQEQRQPQPKPEKAPALATATEKPAEAEAQEPREGRKRSRRGRGRGGERGERREEQRPTQEAVAAPEAAEAAAPREPREAREPRQRREREPRETREPREPREQREPREPREPREARQPRQESQEAISPEAVAPESLPEIAPTPMPVAVEPSVEAAPAPAPVEDIRPVAVAPAEPVAIPVEPAPAVKAQPLATPVQMELVGTKSDLVQIETKARTESAVAESVVAEAPQSAESGREPRRRPAVETGEASSAELVQIETKADKILISPPREEVTDTRPRTRQAFTPPPAESEPLVQVETRK